MPQSQRSEPNTSPVRQCEWTRRSGTPWERSPSPRARAVSEVRPTVHSSRSNPIASSMPQFVGKRVDAIRNSAPDCAVAPVLYSCVDIGVDLIAAGTDLFGRDCRFGEIRRTLLEERRKRFLRFCRAQPLKELLGLDFQSSLSERTDRSLLDEPLTRAQRAARFCRQLLRRFGCGREQI